MEDREILQEIREKVIRLEAFFQSDFKNLEKRVESLENNQKWLICGLITSLMTVLYNFFINK